MTLPMRKIILIVITCLGVTLTSLTLSAFIKTNATNITKGKIIGIKSLKGIKAQGRLDNVTYIYSINGKDYIHTQRIGLRFPKQAIGNGVKVEFKEKHPEESEAVGFYMNYSNSDNKIEFHAPKKYGYHSVELVNDVYFYINYADSGKVIERIYGTYTTDKDTLIVKPFNHDIENKYRTVKYLLVETPNRNRRFGIRNISNNRLYE